MNPTPNELAVVEWSFIKAVWGAEPGTAPAIQWNQNPGQPSALYQS